MTDNSYANECIKCTVKSCKYHNQDANYCSLDAIRVGTHEPHPTEQRCVDCESFEAKG